MKIFLTIMSILILLIAGIIIFSVTSGAKTDSEIYRVIDWTGITPPWWMDTSNLNSRAIEGNTVEISVEYNIAEGKSTQDMFTKWLKEDYKLKNAIQTALKKEVLADGGVWYELSPQMGAKRAEMTVYENSGKLIFKVVGTNR